MKYETPKLVALTSAVQAIQAPKEIPANPDGPLHEEVGAYEDWE
jgi:hypothetical protein